MIRASILVAALMLAAPPALAQGSPPPPPRVILPDFVYEAPPPIASVTDPYVRRVKDLMGILERVSEVMPAPPTASDQAAYRAELDAMMAVIRESRPRLAALRLELESLPALPPGLPADVEAVEVLVLLVDRLIGVTETVMNDYEEFADALAKNDGGRLARALTRVQQNSILSVEALATRLRAMKVVVDGVDPVQGSRVECMALLMDGVVVMTRYSVGGINQKEAGAALKPVNAAIRAELPLAMIGLDAPLPLEGDATILAGMTAISAFVDESEKLAVKLETGRARKFEIDRAFNAMLQQMKTAAAAFEKAPRPEL